MERVRRMMNATEQWRMEMMQCPVLHPLPAPSLRQPSFLAAHQQQQSLHLNALDEWESQYAMEIFNFEAAAFEIANLVVLGLQQRFPQIKFLPIPPPLRPGSSSAPALFYGSASPPVSRSIPVGLRAVVEPKRKSQQISEKKDFS